jgi:hypothetical protein
MSGETRDSGVDKTLIQIWCDPLIAAELSSVDWGPDPSLRRTIATLPRPPELRSPVLSIPPEAGPIVVGVLLHVVATSADALPAHLIGETIYAKIVRPLLHRLPGKVGAEPAKKLKPHKSKVGVKGSRSGGQDRKLRVTITYTGPKGTSRLDLTWGETSSPMTISMPELVTTIATSEDGTRLTVDLPEGTSASAEPRRALHRGNHPH